MSLLLFDGFTAGEAVPAPSVFTSPFAALVELIDRSVLDVLGGEAVVYQPADDDPVEVTGVFDARYVLAKGDPEAGVETLGPAVFLRLDDLPTDPELDDPILIIRALEYRVIERRTDGIGGIVLALRLVA